MWSSSSIPTEAAWSVLKREDYDLTRVMEPEDVKSASKYFETLSPEKQQIMQQVDEAIRQLPDKIRLQLMASAHRLIDEHRGNLGNVLDRAPEEMPESTEPGTFKLTKFVPLVIGAVFALDAINTSQGAKASLVGNVITSIGNGISSSVGGDPNFLGEDPDYGDVFEYDNTAEYTNPFTGEPMGEVIDDPSIWERVSRGAASGALSFVNPFAVAGLGAKTSSRVAGRASEGLAVAGGKATQAAGKKLGSKGMQTEGASAIERAGRNKASRLEEMGKFHDKTGGTGTYGKANRMAGAGSRGNKTVRGVQAGLHNQKLRQMAGSLGAGLLTSDKKPNISGSASATASAGGAGTGVTNKGNRSSSATGENEIFSGTMEKDREKAGHGAYGTNKGDNMKIGEQILKEVDMRIHKAHCGTTHKADCPTCGKGDCKCKDSTKKGSKKPAHGMVIIIGSKDAGPGPSKNGKRVKKD